MPRHLLGWRLTTLSSLRYWLDEGMRAAKDSQRRAGPTSTVPVLTPGMRWLAALFLTSGVVHLVRPQVMDPLIPRALPAARQLIYASGVAELGCALGLLVPSTRRVAGWASAAILLAVFPGNVQMAVTAHGRAQRDSSGLASQAVLVAALARLPLQLPLIRTALRAAGRIR